jgi:subtilisin family serine protease
VLVVCAAGNSADCNPVWPAALAGEFDNVVAVAALDPTGEPAPWSTHGDWVTCSTIGEGVVSTYVEGTEDGPLIDDPDPDTYGPDSWACWTGTSFAAPQITGALVRLMSEDPALDTPLRALRALQQRGGTVDKDYGWSVRILPGT